MRRLLNTQQVADKLGFSADRFYRVREQLYKDRFPRPVFGFGKWGHARYDEGAIDAWLDTKMDPSLRSDRDAVTQHVSAAAKDWTIILEKRLEANA